MSAPSVEPKGKRIQRNAPKVLTPTVAVVPIASALPLPQAPTTKKRATKKRAKAVPVVAVAPVAAVPLDAVTSAPPLPQVTTTNTHQPISTANPPIVIAPIPTAPVVPPLEVPTMNPPAPSDLRAPPRQPSLPPAHPVFLTRRTAAGQAPQLPDNATTILTDDEDEEDDEFVAGTTGEDTEADDEDDGASDSQSSYHDDTEVTRFVPLFDDIKSYSLTFCMLDLHLNVDLAEAIVAAASAAAGPGDYWDLDQRPLLDPEEPEEQELSFDIPLHPPALPALPRKRKRTENTEGPAAVPGRVPISAPRPSSEGPQLVLDKYRSKHKSKIPDVRALRVTAAVMSGQSIENVWVVGEGSDDSAVAGIVQTPANKKRKATQINSYTPYTRIILKHGKELYREKVLFQNGFPSTDDRATLGLESWEASKIALPAASSASSTSVFNNDLLRVVADIAWVTRGHIKKIASSLVEALYGLELPDKLVLTTAPKTHTAFTKARIDMLLKDYKFIYGEFGENIDGSPREDVPFAHPAFAALIYEAVYEPTPATQRRQYDPMPHPLVALAAAAMFAALSEYSTGVRIRNKFTEDVYASHYKQLLDALVEFQTLRPNRCAALMASYTTFCQVRAGQSPPDAPGVPESALRVCGSDSEDDAF